MMRHSLMKKSAIPIREINDCYMVKSNNTYLRWKMDRSGDGLFCFSDMALETCLLIIVFRGSVSDPSEDIQNSEPRF